jgi:hypothetical protein
MEARSPRIREPLESDDAILLRALLLAQTVQSVHPFKPAQVEQSELHNTSDTGTVLR